MSWWEVEGFDLLLTPTIPELPPTLGQFLPTADDPLAGVFRATPMVAFTAPFNITGQPAISVPLHQSAEGLPIGMQLVGAPAREDQLIAVAAQLEAALPWRSTAAPASGPVPAPDRSGVPGVGGRRTAARPVPCRSTTESGELGGDRAERTAGHRPLPSTRTT